MVLVAGDFRSSRTVRAHPLACAQPGPAGTRSHVLGVSCFWSRLLLCFSDHHDPAAPCQLCRTATHARSPSDLHSVVRLSWRTCGSVGPQRPHLAVGCIVSAALLWHVVRAAPTVSRHAARRMARSQAQERLGPGIPLYSAKHAARSLLRARS